MVNFRLPTFGFRKRSKDDDSSSSESGEIRQKSIRRTKLQHLPGSYAKKGAEEVKNVVRHYKSFGSLKSSATDKIEFTLEDYQALQEETAAKCLEVMSKSDASGWEILQNPIIYQPAIETRWKSTSKYDNTVVEMEDLCLWDNFPGVSEIEDFIKSIPELSHLFMEIALENALAKNWREKLYGKENYMPSNAENSLAINYRDFFKELEALIRLACQGVPGSVKGLIDGKKWITTAGGKCAMKRREEGNAQSKDPDLTSFWTDGDYSHLNATIANPQPGREVTCLLVGDYKMTTKFYHDMLFPNADGEFEKDAQNVVNQIHDYMDMHHNRYGYIITQEELIMFRRREDPDNTWGQMDFSPSIPVTAERGELNAMMVLWYFQVKYAVLGNDEGWKLESYYNSCPDNLLGSSVKKQRPAADDWRLKNKHVRS
jgi:hypothetical protein